MSWYQGSPHTSEYDRDLAFLIDKYKELHKDYTDLNDVYHELLNVYENIKDELEVITSSILDEWLEDGTLEDIINVEIFGKLNTSIEVLEIGHIHTEDDFIKYEHVPRWELVEDIEITRPVDTFASMQRHLNLNGHTITVSNDYPKNIKYIFKIGHDVDFVEEKNKSKTVENGFIECSGVDLAIFNIKLAWRLHINNLKITNNVRGLFEYGTKDYGSYGAECVVSNVVIEHYQYSDDEYSGMNVLFGDSSFTDVYIVWFKYGVTVESGNNTFHNIHPWGYPKRNDIQYNIGTYMAIGFRVLTSNIRLISCTADTFEVKNLDNNPSYANGGVGFYLLGANISLYGCYTINHANTNNSLHIGYFFSDYSPITGLRYYSERCSITASHVNTAPSSSVPFKYRITLFSDVPISVVNCGFNKKSANETKYAMNEFPASSTFFTNEYEFDESPAKFNYVPDDRSFKINTIGDILCAHLKTDGVYGVHYSMPYFYNYCNSISEVNTLRNNIVKSMERSGNRYLGNIYLAIFNDSGIRKLIFFDSGAKRFYYLDGTIVPQS